MKSSRELFEGLVNSANEKVKNYNKSHDPASGRFSSGGGSSSGGSSSSDGYNSKAYSEKIKKNNIDNVKFSKEEKSLISHLVTEERDLRKEPGSSSDIANNAVIGRNFNLDNPEKTAIMKNGVDIGGIVVTRMVDDSSGPEMDYGGTRVKFSALKDKSGTKIENNRIIAVIRPKNLIYDNYSSDSRLEVVAIDSRTGNRVNEKSIPKKYSEAFNSAKSAADEHLSIIQGIQNKIDF